MYWCVTGYERTPCQYKSDMSVTWFIAYQVVDLIGEAVICLDSRNVGVDEDRGDTGLLQGLQSLRSYV